MILELKDWCFTFRVASYFAFPMPLLRVAVVNPTSIRNKACEFNSLSADVIAVSECAATHSVQKQQSHLYRKVGLRAIWGEPVSSHRVLDGRETVKGAASGVCVFSRVSVRESRKSLPEHWRKTCRLLVTYIQLSNCSIRLIVMYGVPAGSSDQAVKNNSLWRAVHSLLIEHNIPTIVAGDFNAPPQKAEAWNDIKPLGYTELFELHQAKYGELLPATCKGSTRNDSMIFSHHLTQMYRSAEVVHDAPFRTHSPIIASFDLQPLQFRRRDFCMPTALVDSVLNSDLFKNFQLKQFEENQAAFDAILQQDCDQDVLSKGFAHVGKQFEAAYDKTVQYLHQFMPDDAPPINPPKGHGRLRPCPLKLKPSRVGPSHARCGAYNPPCEVFKLRTLQWVKQLRRLQSMLIIVAKYDCLIPPPSVVKQMEREWSAIKSANGFKPCFARWCLQHGGLEVFYDDIPPHQWLSTLTDAFRRATDNVCLTEDKTYQRVEQYATQLDLLYFGSSGAFRKLKAPKPPLMEHLWIDFSHDSVLIRNPTKGLPQARVSFADEIEPSLPLTLDGNDVTILDVKDDVFTLGDLPPRVGNLIHFHQKRPVHDPEELHREFFDFWAPFWLRDQGEMQIDVNAWPEFLELASSVGFGEGSVTHHPTSVADWRTAIKHTKSSTARGACGFSQPELASLEDFFLQNLASLFEKATACGLPEWLLIARVALIPKVENASTVGQMRPITVFALVFRIWSKIVAKRLLQAWSYTLPPTVTAGLPRRSCAHLAFRNAITIESHQVVKSSIGGYVLDITKCYNAFPRAPLVWLLVSQGMSSEEASLWQLSMLNMSRVVQMSDSYSTPVKASTGMAEGDPIAVCGMALVAFLWHSLLVPTGAEPSSFADNWSWIASTGQQHLAALRITHRLLLAMKLSSDPAKCWAWGTDSVSRKAWHEISVLVFGNPRAIKVVLEEKDLGVQMHYGPSTHLGCLSTRLSKGISAIRKLTNSPYCIAKKAHLTMSGVFPAMFYGAFACYIGQKNFRSIRTAIGDSILHRTSNSNPWLVASLLHHNLLDPLVFVIRESLGIWFTFLHRYPDMRERLYTLLGQASDQPHFAVGPASALKCYLGQLGWKIEGEGRITDHIGVQWFLHNMTWPAICDRLYQAWNCVVTNHIRSRKGLSEIPTIQIPLSNSFGNDTDPRMTKCLALHQTLSPIFQTQKLRWKDSRVQSIHDNSPDEINGDLSEPDRCPLCGAVDTQMHFVMECPKQQDIRDTYPGLFDKIKEHAAWTFVLPVIWKHPEHDLLTLRNFARELPPPFVCKPLDKLVFYVDGTCTNPASQFGKQAAFAIIQDITHNIFAMSDQIRAYQSCGVEPWGLSVCQSGFVPGIQTINRAELAAILQVIKSVNSATIYSDSLTAISIFELLQNKSELDRFLKHSCFDLIVELSAILATKSADAFTVVKVKAHRADNGAVDEQDMFHILGNRAADAAAKQCVKVPGIETLEMAQRVANFYRQSAEILWQYNDILVHMDQRRMDAWTIFRSGRQAGDSPEGLDDNLGQQQLVELDFSTPPRECFLAFMPGALFLQKFLAWAKMLRWPQFLVPTVHSHQCISQQELVLNFLLCIQTSFPRITSRGPAAGQLSYTDPCLDPLALLIPLSMQDAVKLFQHTVLFLDKFWGVQTMPKSVYKQAKMLFWLGNRTVVSGYATRPCLPHCDIHDKLLRNAVSETGIIIPHIPKVDAVAQISVPCDFPTLSSQEIFRNYKQLYKQLYKERRL